MSARVSIISFFWAFLFAVTASAEPLRLVRIDSENARALASELERAGYDVLGASVTESSLELVVSAAEMAVLQRQGHAPATLSFGRPFAEIQAGRQALELITPGYPTLIEIVNQMNAMAAAAPTICKMVDLTTTYNVPPTVEGRHLFAVKISDNVAQDEDEPTFLMVSGHHSREIVTPVLALYAVDRLTALYGADPAVTRIVDENEIWIAPVWNPDGYDYVFNRDNLWRKNRRVFPMGIGVDLNRNYPFGWHNPCSGSNQPSSNKYKGPEPASEAETKTMIAWSRDRHFAKVLDYHSSGREVLHGYVCWSHPLDFYLQQSAASLSMASGYGGRIRPPSADGEHFEWQLAVRGALAFLTETHIEHQR
jgi:murein tripeptide amidase MpaA